MAVLFKHDQTSCLVYSLIMFDTIGNNNTTVCSVMEWQNTLYDGKHSNKLSYAVYVIIVLIGCACSEMNQGNPTCLSRSTDHLQDKTNIAQQLLILLLLM